MPENRLQIADLTRVTLRFYDRRGDRWRCRVCHKADGVHTEVCPVLALDTDLREIAASLGLCISAIHETVTGMRAHLLPPDPSFPGDADAS